MSLLLRIRFEVTFSSVLIRLTSFSELIDHGIAFCYLVPFDLASLSHFAFALWFLVLRKIRNFENSREVR